MPESNDNGSIESTDSRDQLVQSFVEKMKATGMRATPKRIRMISLLLEADGPVSALDVREQLSEYTPDLATIYRAMDAFEELGLVRRMYSEDGTGLFQICPKSSEVARLICRSCFHSEPVLPSLSQIVEEHARNQGFAQVGPVVEIYGVCQECQDPK
ncbi:MAG: Fur family transcriptional regulator [Verrucomicrobiota bacterium]